MITKKIVKDIIVLSNEKFEVKNPVYKINFIYYRDFDSIRQFLYDYYFIIIDVRCVNLKKLLNLFHVIKPKAYIVLYSPEKMNKDIYFSFYQSISKIDDDVINYILKGANNYYYMTKKYLEVQKHLEDLNKIGISLSSERETSKLLDLILLKGKEITQSDAGSLYIIENQKNRKILKFKLTHCDSIPVKYEEYIMPINDKSIAGYVAMTGKILNINDIHKQNKEKMPYSFNNKFDLKSGYHTINMLVVPMKNTKNEVIGVLQLINRKKSKIKLTKTNYEKIIIPYDTFCEDLAMSLAGQASVALENSSLYENINKLFESFVTASIFAIESRDPITNGHSLRVAELSLRIACEINKIKKGKFKNVKFSDDDLKELQYASILHDFGKIGVCENVLTKSSKLFDRQLENILLKFDLLKMYHNNIIFKKETDILKKHISKIESLNLLKKLENEKDKFFKKLNYYKQLIIKLNATGYVEEKFFNELKKIKKLFFKTDEGEKVYLLTNDDYEKLSIRTGSLDTKEREEIESHVLKSYKFLKQINWIDGLSRVPEFALKHHERLNGSGYPDHLKANKIPLQARIIALADIYDAITAWDRPYKKAISVDKTLAILNEEVKSNKLDKDIFKIFVEKKLYI